MSSEKTINYSMHKWVGSDSPMRAEFNENFEKIDTEIKSHATSLADKQTQLDDIYINVDNYTSLAVSMGDGFKNWTPAIQQAINDAVASKKRVLLSADYTIYTTIELPTETVTMCSVNRNVTVKAMADMSYMFHKGIGVSTNDIFENFSVDGNKKANYCFYIEQARAYNFDKLTLRNFKISGITFNDVNNVGGAVIYECKIGRCYFRGLTDDGINLASERPDYLIELKAGASDNIIYNDNTFINAKLACIKDWGLGGNNRIMQNHFFSYPAPTWCPTYFIDCDGAIVINNNYFDTALTGIKHTGDDFAITNNTFFWNPSTSPMSAIGIDCYKRPSWNIGKAIVCNNTFHFSNNVTLTNDVKIEAYDYNTCVIKNNVSDGATNKFNIGKEYLATRKASSSSSGTVIGNTYAIIAEFFSSGNGQIAYRDLTTGTDYDKIYFSPNGITFTANNAIFSGLIKGLAGDAASRPIANLTVGAMYYDSTLKKPIWWDGTTWKDATGTTV